MTPTETLERPLTATALLSGWLGDFEAALSESPEAAAALFEEDGFWRDLLAFTWNVATMEGRPAIAEMLRATLGHVAPSGFVLDGPVEEGAGEGAGTVSAWIRFETAHALGRGRVTLRGGRAQVLLTATADLKGHEEPLGPRRPQGTSHVPERGRETWTDRRRAHTARMGREEQPHTLIIGGGQGGLALGARLRHLGVPALIVEKNPRAGDSWRNRYRSLVLHDPVWYDHMPYLPFPPGWPVFTPKDKMGDWLEAYANIFELDLWTSTTADRAVWDPEAREWTVTVTRAGEEITLTPKELVFATGAYGPPREIDWPGREGYGGTLIHSAAYRAPEDWKGKRCVVVGAGSSAHDVAVDLWEAGAEVTLLQRSPSIVVRSETLMELGFDIYSEAALARGIDTDTADMLAAATPFKLFCEGQKDLYKVIRERDAAFYEALGRAGFDYDFGEDESGLMSRALRTASGYYIDVGASTLIAEGRIGVAKGSVAGMTADGVRLDDGREIAADLVVACTGYQSMNEAVAGIVSREAADMVGPCWGLGSGVPGDPGPWQGELRNMWKPTAHDALWFHGGNLALSRFYSRVVALQLKARMEGIPTPVFGRPAPAIRA